MSFTDLEIYKDSFNLAIELHKFSLELPNYEKYELGAQLRKASKSVSLNIAEGYGRKRYEHDFAKFLVNAIGSANETRACLSFALNLGYLDNKQYNYFFIKYDILGKRINA